MNHIYKLKFDKRRNELVVVSELTSGVGKAKATGSVEGGKALRRGVRTMALSLLSGMIMMAHPVTAANLPTGGQIVAGSGNIQTPSGNQMNIHQHSQNMVANWNSFDIGKGNTVQFFQPDSSAVALNRVVGGGESQIMGNLKANGQVFLVNPNGVLFGKDASVSTSGFVASTRDIKNDDFMNRRYTFSGGQKAGAAIVNQGALTTNAGGYIVLAADRVSNSGTIRTPDGKAVLAATERVTLQLDNGGLTSVQVTGDVVNALVENRGLVSARNGQVFLTAHGRDMLMNTVLNVSGVVEAGGMHRRDGNIVLDGGNSGVVHLSGSLQADNASGKGGKIVVQGQNLLLDKGSSITATGSQGGGEVYVGGGWQGKDAGIRNADKVVMQDSALIDVSATDTGNGGTAVLWSESFTNFRGQISAKGGEQGGNGGKVETSSRGNLQAFGTVTASAKKGLAGNWLLDPADITIVSATSDTNVSNSNGIFTPNSKSSQVANTTINNRLNNGTSVTIQTSHASISSKGNITVNADITKTSGSDASLTLKADGDITVNKNITVSHNSGKLDVNLLAANTTNGSAVTIKTGANITTNGGNITIASANNSNVIRINVTGGNTTLNAGAGNVSLSGQDVLLNIASINAGNINLNGTGNITVLNSTLNTTSKGNISLLAAGGNTAMIKVENSNLSSNGGRITLDRMTDGENNAMTVKVVNSTLNASSSSDRGNITIKAYNPNINLSKSAWNATVRNGGSLLEINNSTLSGKNLTLEGNQIGENSRNLPVYLNNATLTTEGGNITLTGRSSNGSNAAQLELRATNTLTANNGSIIINHDKSDGASNTSALLLNGNNTLNATNGNISLMGNWTRFIYNELDDHAVVKINGNATLISTGGINISGTGSQTGVAFGNVSVVLKGNTSITGTGASGVVFAGIVNINATGYNVSINGNATSNTGLYIKRAGVLFQQRYWSGGNIHIAAQTINVNGSSNTNASGVEGIIYSYNGKQYTNVTLNASNISINGSSKNGDGVRFDNLTTITKNASIRGVSNDSGSGVQIAGNLSNTTINGSSQSGNGVTVSTVKAWGGLNPGNLTGDGNSSITGSSDTGNGVSIWGNVSGVNFINGSSSNASGNGSGVDINGSVNGGQISGNATGNGAGVDISGNSTLNNTTVNGNGTDGSGVNISGNLTGDANSTITGNASGNGNGVNISGNITDGNITGNATGNGAGVDISGNSTLNNTTVNGNGTDGSGVNISGNLTGDANSTITGNASGNGNGVNISGNITDGNITGNATGNGAGVDISGNSTLNNTTVNGNGTDGSGVNISGNLTGDANSTITGNASGNGNGVNISGNITDGNITGNATGNGVDVYISGNSILNNTTVNGNGTNGSGPGVDINGSVNGGQISGNASGNGNGVNISGNITGGNITGNAVNGVSVKEYYTVQQLSQRNQAALRALRSEGSDVLESSGYRAEQQTLTIRVCDDEKNCTRSTVSSEGTDVQPPHRNTGVVATPLSSGSTKNR